MFDIVLGCVAVLFVVAGLAGAFLPGLPGPPLVFVGLFIAACIHHFARVGWLTIGVFFMLTLAAMIGEYAAGGFAAKRFGGSRLAVAGAIAGTFAGLFFGLPGLLLGPFLGAAGAEYWTRRDLLQSGKVGLGSLLGLAIAVGLKLTAIFGMLGLFILAYML